MTELISSVEMGANRYGYPVAFITVGHRNYHYQQTCTETHAIVEVLEMQKPHRFECIKIPHQFKDGAWIIFSREKDQLHAFVVPMSFFDVVKNGVFTAHDLQEAIRDKLPEAERRRQYKEFFENTRALRSALLQAALEEFEWEFAKPNPFEQVKIGSRYSVNGCPNPNIEIIPTEIIAPKAHNDMPSIYQKLFVAYVQNGDDGDLSNVRIVSIEEFVNKYTLKKEK